MKISIDSFNIAFYDYNDHIFKNPYGEFFKDCGRNIANQYHDKSKSDFSKRTVARPKSHIDIYFSLVFSCDIENYQTTRKDELTKILFDVIDKNKICAGDFVQLSDIQIFSYNKRKKIGDYLMPSYILVDRTNLLDIECKTKKNRFYGTLYDLYMFLRCKKNKDVFRNLQNCKIA